MKLQRQIANGNWVEVSRDNQEYFLSKCVTFLSLSLEEVCRKLHLGKPLSYDSDWYANLRDVEAVNALQQQQEAKRRSPDRDYPTGRRLSCGHTVYFSAHIMSTSSGPSCMDCYDRMS